MKTILAFAALLMTGMAHAASYVEHATVLSSTPVYQRSATPVCSEVPVTRVTSSSDTEQLAGSLVGGVLGGVLGHQIGGGRGREVATVAGAIAGTMTGRNLAQRPSVETTYEQTCQESARNILTGYSVVYSFHGTQGTVQMPYDPGYQLEMRVTVEPVLH